MGRRGSRVGAWLARRPAVQELGDQLLTLAARRVLAAPRPASPARPQPQVADLLVAFSVGVAATVLLNDALARR